MREEHPLSYSMVVLGTTLAISAMANVWMFNTREDMVHEVEKAKEASTWNATQLRVCSASVDTLEAEAEADEVAATAARVKAAPIVRSKQVEAQEILSTAPSAPADDCKSTNDLLRTWQSSRKLK
jgi:hypothetical protein